MSRLAMTSIAVFAGAGSGNAEELLVYFGTYTGGENGSQGIYRAMLDLDTGELRDLVLAAETENPSFLEIHPGGGFVYAVGEMGAGGGVTAFRVDPADGRLERINSQSSGGPGPCHVTVDPTGTHVLVANYGGGSTSVIPIREDGGLAEPSSFVQHEGSSVNPQRQEGPHAHSVNLSPDGRFAYVADLGLDQVLIYAFDRGSGAIRPADPAFAATAPGSGPRHFAFHPDGTFAFVINEMASTITVFRQDRATGALTELQTISTLPEGFEGNSSTAEVRVHPNGRFVYGSNRGHDSIAVFRCDPATGALTFVENEPVQGKTPRNFNIDPTGEFCLVANQSTDNVVVFRIDQETGALEPTGHSISVGRPVCVRFLGEPGFEALFDGRSFEGWEGDREWFRIEDGAVVAGSLERAIPRNEFLASVGEFGDFELRFEAKLSGEGRNAGVQFRSQRIPDDHEMIGYQCDIGEGGDWGTIWGWLYDESRRRRMLAPERGEGAAAAVFIRENDWNALRVRAEGDRIRIWVNGIPTVDYRETDADIPRKGRFGLQIHSGPPSECRYRNIRIKKL